MLSLYYIYRLIATLNLRLFGNNTKYFSPLSGGEPPRPAAPQWWGNKKLVAPAKVRPANERTPRYYKPRDRLCSIFWITVEDRTSWNSHHESVHGTNPQPSQQITSSDVTLFTSYSVTGKVRSCISKFSRPCTSRFTVGFSILFGAIRKTTKMIVATTKTYAVNVVDKIDFNSFIIFPYRVIAIIYIPKASQDKDITHSPTIAGSKRLINLIIECYRSLSRVQHFVDFYQRESAVILIPFR